MAINKSEISCNLGREGDKVKLLHTVFGYQEKLWESANVFYKGPDKYVTLSQLLNSVLVAQRVMCKWVSVEVSDETLLKRWGVDLAPPRHYLPTLVFI